VKLNGVIDSCKNTQKKYAMQFSFDESYLKKGARGFLFQKANIPITRSFTSKNARCVPNKCTIHGNQVHQAPN